MNDFIRRRIARQPRNLGDQLLLALGCFAAATLLRLGLSPIVGPEGVPFITYFPAVMMAALLGGPAAGFICLGVSSIAGAWLFLPPAFALIRAPDQLAAVVAFALSAGIVAWLCHLLGRTVQDLAVANEHEHRLVLELQHRVKNTLAIVQSLAAQTFRAAGEGLAFKTAFTDRLIALGRAHNILSETAWGQVTLAELVRRTVEPFMGGRTERLSAAGEPVSLPADLVVDLALCLHELATNATKYGALQSPHGRIAITWRLVEGPTPRASLTWREDKGPAVEPPSRKGFGSRLLERGLSNRFHPQVAARFEPDGLVWTAEFDVPND